MVTNGISHNINANKNTILRMETEMLSMNSYELARRIIDCLSDGYDDEEDREETGNTLYNELSQIENGSVKIALLKLCEIIEELEL